VVVTVGLVVGVKMVVVQIGTSTAFGVWVLVGKVSMTFRIPVLVALHRLVIVARWWCVRTTVACVIAMDKEGTRHPIRMAVGGRRIVGMWWSLCSGVWIYMRDYGV